MPRRKQRVCDVCERRPVQHKRAGLCNACYSALYYWSRKTPTEIRERELNLEVYAKRMSLLSPSNRRK